MCAKIYHYTIYMITEKYYSVKQLFIEIFATYGC